jgi:hypothetical protein
MRKSYWFLGSLVLCLAGWVLLSFAGINAEYKVEVNLAPMGSGIVPTYAEFLRERRSELIWYFVPDLRTPDAAMPQALFILLFFGPAIAVLITRSKNIMLVCILGAAIMMVFDVLQLLAFEGGDRKGCEGCFVPFIGHVLLGGLTFFLALATRKSQTPNVEFDADADRRRST